MERSTKQIDQSLPDTGYVRLPQVLRHYPVSRTTWWRGVRSHDYPQPVRLGARCVAWRVEDIRGLIERASSEIKKAGAA